MKKAITILFSLFSLSAFSQYGYINTVAGTGSSGYSGDGGCALIGHIGGAGKPIFDHLGNYYFCEANHTIRKVSNIGIISTFAGTGVPGYSGDSGPATAAKLHMPNFVVVDMANNIFVADENNHRIRRIDAITNIITTFAGNGSPGFGGDGFPATDASLYDPYGICRDPYGNFYITDHLNYRIRKIDTSGIIHTVAGVGTIGIDSGDNGPATAAGLGDMYGICTDDSGNVYFCDNEMIRKINVTTGIITRYAGTGIAGNTGDGTPASTAQIGGPVDVEFDKAKHCLYISDLPNYNIRMVDSLGIIHTIAGTGSTTFGGDGGPATAASLWSPTGVSCDSLCNLYISDNGHFRIRKITYDTTHLAPSVSIIVSPNDTICAGSGVSFTSSIFGTIPIGYQWYVNGSTVSTSGSAYSYTPLNGDSVRCVVTSGSACLGIVTASSNTINMVVDTLITRTISLAGVITAPVGSSVTLTASVSSAGSSYIIRWLNHGIEFTTTTVPSVTYTKGTGTDTITARVVSTAVYGCFDSTTSAAHVVMANTLGIGNVLAQTGKIMLSPNPANTTLTITSASKISTITLTNLLGQTMLYKGGKSEQEEVNVGLLPAGVYIVRVRDSEGKTTVSKIIKQ